MSNTGIDYKQFVDIATKLNIMNIENQESMIDGSSISLLTAKLNAFISLYMIGKDETCKRQFIELWKSQYVELNSITLQFAAKLSVVNLAAPLTTPFK